MPQRVTAAEFVAAWHKAGGFVVQADGWEQVAHALRRKLVWEISQR